MIPVFKGVNDDMSAPQDEHFFYPTSGPVHDRDGWGLHGLPYGIGPSHWYDFIEKPRYLILMAPEVSHCIAQGKCSFKTATVVACYTNIIDAAKHMSSLTRNWTTPAAAKRARYVPDHHRHLIDIARKFVSREDVTRIYDNMMQRAYAEAQQKKRKAERQALRDAYRGGIFVPSWPVALSSGETKVAPFTQNDTAPERARVLVPRTRSGAGEAR